METGSSLIPLTEITIRRPIFLQILFSPDLILHFHCEGHKFFSPIPKTRKMGFAADITSEPHMNS